MATLYIWTVVAALNTQPVYDWRANGEYASVKACENARIALGIATAQRSICINNGK